MSIYTSWVCVPWVFIVHLFAAPFLFQNKRSTRQCSGSLLLFHIKSTLTKNNAILGNKSLFMLWFPVRFGFLLHSEVTYLKKLDVKTFSYSSSNSGTQRCNGRKSHLSKLLSFVPNQRLPYKLVDRCWLSWCCLPWSWRSTAWQRVRSPW